MSDAPCTSSLVTNRSLDAYERAHMRVSSGAYRERTRMPLWGLVPLCTLSFAGAAASPLAVVSLATLVFVLFSVVRVAIDDTALMVHWGWKRKTIPLASVRYAVVTSYFLGARTKNHDVFAPLMGPRTGVKVVYAERGVEKSLTIASKDAERLVAVVTAALPSRRCLNEAPEAVPS